jgi:acetyltransferase-like isoleucine patch superfamily enzyme
MLKKSTISISFFNKIHNLTYYGFNRIGKFNSLKSIDLGKYSYIGDYCNFNNTSIGKFCSIGSRVHLLSGSHPTRIFVSTHPSFYSTLKQVPITFTSQNTFNEYSLNSFGRLLTIENDVWIGSNVTILQGFIIKSGAIVGAGSLVNRDVLPYEIVAGVPIKHIRFRFPEEIINRLLEINWWDFNIEKIKKYSKYMHDYSKFLARLKDESL